LPENDTLHSGTYQKALFPFQPPFYQTQGKSRKDYKQSAKETENLSYQGGDSRPNACDVMNITSSELKITSQGYSFQQETEKAKKNEERKTINCKAEKMHKM